MVDFTAVDNLVAALRAADLNVDADPAQVRTPGVWVRNVGLSLDLVGGYTHQLQLHLVVPDNGYVRSRDALGELLTTVLTVVDPDDDPFFQGLVLPSVGKALPGLVVPFNLMTEYA